MRTGLRGWNVLCRSAERPPGHTPFSEAGNGVAKECETD